MTGKENRKKDVIPTSNVFRPDPFGDLEDSRPVEIRKGRRNNPDKTIPWVM